uniref:Antitoxin n=1 Tax=Archaeoglobus fulgidus TaxID=2234 RepID=A0A7J3LZZ7_ARCFL
MPKIIEAIYEDGVFKPLEKVEIREGEKVRLRVEESIANTLRKYRGKFKISQKEVEEFLELRR